MSFFVLVQCNGTTTQQLLDGDFIATNSKRIVLVSPLSGQLIVAQSQTFLWTSINGAGKYQIQIAKDSQFAQIVLDRIVTENYFTLSSADTSVQLASGNYHWRVRVAYLKNNLESEALAFGFLPVAANGGFTLYVNGASAVTPLQGTQTNPYTTISGAIAGASSIRVGDTTKPVQIRVASGTYAEYFTLRGGMSLFGGYDGSNWSRNVTTNQTILEPPASGASALRVDEETTLALRGSTVIDGFYFGAIKAASSGSNGLITLSGASPTITNNYFNSYSASLFQRCIYASGGSPLISSNAFNKSTTQDASIGKFEGSSDVTFSANTLTITGYLDRVLEFISSAGSVIGNSISVANSTSVLIVYLFTNSTTVITRNTINITVASGELRAIYNDDGSAGTITNNIVTANHTGGTGANSAAITMFSGSPTITNNTLIHRWTGGSPTYHAIYRQGTDPTTVITARISNNIIIAATGSGAQTCLGNLATQDVRTNVLVNCSEGITSGAITGITNSTGNIGYTWANFATLAFQGGATYADGMDLRLTAGSPVSMRLGGLNAATSVCGSGSTSCGSVTVDRNNIARTCPTAGTDCFSIGAYELD